MRPLDADAIQAMKALVKEGTQPCPLYAIDYGDIIAVTNNSILLEWPKDQVEDCSQLSKLLDTRNHKLASPNADNLAATHWTDPVFREGGRFVKADEVEPEDGEDGQIAYVHGVVRIRYSWLNFTIVEMFLDDPIYKMYVLRDQDVLYPMGVYDRKQLVGAFANDRRGEHEQ